MVARISGWLLEHYYMIAATVSRWLLGNNNAVASVSWLSLGCFGWLPRHYYPAVMCLVNCEGVAKWLLGILWSW